MDLINKIYLTFTRYIKANKNINEEFKIAMNEIKERLTYFKQLKNYVFQLTSFPTIPKTPVAPKRKLIVSLTFVFSLFLFIVLVLLVESLKSKNNSILMKV
jgi:LPS O-antigen subunit length determinant protein (WzzB/FepE family)